jgi:hypothetical protein
MAACFRCWRIRAGHLTPLGGFRRVCGPGLAGLLSLAGLLHLLGVSTAGAQWAPLPPSALVGAQVQAAGRDLAPAESAATAEPKATPAIATPEAGRIEREELWQIVFLSGQRVGYARVLVDQVDRDGQPPVVATTVEMHMTIKRFGQTLVMSTHGTSEETVDGDLIQFAFRMDNPPAASTLSNGRVSDRQLEIHSEINGKKSTKTIPLPEDLKSPAFQERLLKQHPLKEGEELTFRAFSPELGKIATITVKAGGRETISLLDKSTAELQLMTVTNSLLPGLATKAWVDEQGNTVKSATAMLGTQMVTWSVSKEQALETISGQELDLAVSTLVKSQKIERPYDTQEVVYRVTLPADRPEKVLSQAPQQTVKPVSEHVAEVTVKRLAIPVGAKIETVEPEYIDPTPFLQSDDEQVRKHATAAAGDLTDPGAIAVAMERYVHEKLTQKNFSTALASASEVARSLSGDCSEHAVLLAAMLRAKGIPSRAVVGLVYVDGDASFGGHMWTEAKLGSDWIPLDATLGRRGIGGSHLKFGDATFSEKEGAPLTAFTSLMGIIGNMQIDVLSSR